MIKSTKVAAHRIVGLSEYSIDYHHDDYLTTSSRFIELSGCTTQFRILK